VVVSNGGSLSAPERVAVADTWPTIVSAGIGRHGGVDLILTGISPEDTANSVMLVAAGQKCRVAALQPIRTQRGFYFAHVTGCQVMAGQSIQAFALKSKSSSRVVGSQAETR
jgi:hypothetical protein